MKKKRQKTGSFRATDKDGREYEVIIYTTFIDAGTFDNPSSVVEGSKELQTSDGMCINRLQQGVYKIVQTGVIIRSNSPEAL